MITHPCRKSQTMPVNEAYEKILSYDCLFCVAFQRLTAIRYQPSSVRPLRVVSAKPPATPSPDVARPEASMKICRRWAMGYVTLVAFTGTSIMVPYLSSQCNSLEDRVPVDFIYGYPLCQWVAVTRKGWEGTKTVIQVMANRYHALYMYGTQPAWS